MAKHAVSLVQAATDRPEATGTLLGVAYTGDVGDTRAVLDREAWAAVGFDVTVLGDGRGQ